MQKSEKSSPDRGSKARGRPRAFDRKAALAAATRLFWVKGYTASSISDLAEAMGIGSPSLYAAFGSKEALYKEAVAHYSTTYEYLVWQRFTEAPTARDAVKALLMDSAAALTGSLEDTPLGCMVTLSAVGNEGYPDLGRTVSSARALLGDQLLARLKKARDEGETLPSTDIEALARLVRITQNGMSILARDGVGRAELEAAARVAMDTWDARVTAVRDDQKRLPD